MLYYLNSSGPDRHALQAGIARLLELGQNTSQAAIASHQLANFFGGSIISEVLSPAEHAAFYTNRSVTLANVQVFMMTEKNNAPAFTRGPILAMHVSSQLLKRLMKDSRSTDLIFVPWSEVERDAFTAENPDAVAIPFTPDHDP